MDEGMIGRAGNDGCNGATEVKQGLVAFHEVKSVASVVTATATPIKMILPGKEVRR
jgi:hypothetical protein